MSQGGAFYLTTREVAADLGLKPKTIRAWRLDGKGPPFKKPAGARSPALYPREEYEQWKSTR